MSLQVLKWAQIALAVLLTGFFVLLLPGAGAMLVPVGCLYVVWAVRARSDRTLSVWLAFLFTLIIAFLAGLSASRPVAHAESWIYRTLFLIAALVVALHCINWRWLMSPASETRRQIGEWP